MERREVGVREWEWARGDGVGEKKASGLKVAVLGGGGRGGGSRMVEVCWGVGEKVGDGGISVVV